MKRYIFYLSALFILFSCHEDKDEVIQIIDNPEPPEVLVTTRLVSILDPATLTTYTPVQTFAGKTTTFDNLPYGQVKSSGINRDNEVIRLSTGSGLNFYTSQSLVENDINYTHLAIPAHSTSTGNASSDQQFTLGAENTLTVSANSLNNPDGSDYIGNYEVTLATIRANDLSAPNIPSHTAIRPNNDLASLVFDNCFYIVFRSPQGITLTGDENVYITLPGNTQNQGWYFDPDKGIWMTTGEKEMESTQIPVKSSGYYAAAQALPLTRVKGTLTINGIATPHYPIHITYADQRRLIYTTNTGAWALQVPSETAFTAHVLLPCGTEQTVSFTTPADDEMQTALSVVDDDTEVASVLGIARDCNLNPLNDQLVIFESESRTVIFSPDPAIHFPVPVCKNGSVSVTSINMINGQTGPSIEWPAADTIRIYSSMACTDAQDEYLSLFVSGEQKIYWSLKTELAPGDRLLIEDDGNEPDLDFQVFVEGFSTGAYQDNMLNILFEDMHLGAKGYSLYCPTASSGCGFTTFTITHYPEQTGEWIRGHFEGKFWIKTFNPLTAGYRPVEGDFQVYRDF
jgi:hypothetical protein